MLADRQIVGPYELIRKLGAGPFSDVWLASHAGGGAHIALKILTDPGLVAEFRRQHQIFSNAELRPVGGTPSLEVYYALRHPNIVRVQAIDAFHTPPYLVMDAVEGQDLRAVLHDRKVLPPQEALCILRHVLGVLVAAHAAGVTHCDLKPENILLTAQGAVRITDFGLGKVHADIARSLLLMGGSCIRRKQAIAGAYPYMSPELIRGGDPLPVDDLFALGIIACELLTGERPTLWLRAEELLAEVGLPPYICSAVQKALLRRSGRYPSAACMLTAVRAIARHSLKDRHHTILHDNTEADCQRPDAKFKLGIMYYQSPAGRRDHPEAVKLFRAAAEQGHSLAQYWLGFCLERGEGTAQNRPEAVRWFRAAAEQGQPDAQYRLARCCEDGTEVKRDTAQATFLYERAAENGNAFAQRELGLRLQTGRGVTVNIAEAAKWFRLAADGGDAAARYYLGECYEVGRGVPQDDAKAMEWYDAATGDARARAAYKRLEAKLDAEDEEDRTEPFREAAERGDAEAQFRLATEYLDAAGGFVSKRLPLRKSKRLFKAWRWLCSAAEQGHEQAKTRLSSWYEEEITFDCCCDAAERGDAEALARLGTFCLNPPGSPGETGNDFRDFVTKAFESLHSAAENGYLRAQIDLGDYYRNTTEEEERGHEREAVKWYRKAAEQGHAGAQFMLAQCYSNLGADMERRARREAACDHYREAAQWFRMAAEQGDADAQFRLAQGCGGMVSRRAAAEQGNADAQSNLAICYDERRCAPEDKAEAIKWFRMAAEQGHAGAQKELADGYLNGLGVPKDEEEAVKWYRKAAEQGHTEAMRSLARCYELGQGVPQDPAEASGWSQKAAERDAHRYDVPTFDDVPF